MKNVQFIDGANNSAYDVFACSDEDFKALFPGEGQNIEFIEDVSAKIGDNAAGEIIIRISKSPICKSDVHGIHGTMFFGLEQKRKYYPNKRESDLNRARGWDHD